MFQVNDGDRVLRFEGELLAHSSSYHSGSHRWVEFDLYRTEGGSYVVSRVGYSNLFHAAGCPIVNKRRHQPAQVATLTENSVPCDVCNPSMSIDEHAHEMIYPERPLPWAQAAADAEAAIEALAQYDVDGNRYFTHVARSLIRDAADVDDALKDAYYVEVIA